jgi:hypothetical protein
MTRKYRHGWQPAAAAAATTTTTTSGIEKKIEGEDRTAHVLRTRPAKLTANKIAKTVDFSYLGTMSDRSKCPLRGDSAKCV